MIHPNTEQIFATLELLVDRLPFDLPCHEDGGYIYPFIWNSNIQGEFNTFNLCRSNNWIKLTDMALVIKQWQGLTYTQAFSESILNDSQIEAWHDGIRSLEQSINCLNNLQSYDFQFPNDVSPNGIILGQTDDGHWLGITSTVYLASNIPKATLDFTRNFQPTLNIEADRSHISHQIAETISSLQSFDLSGDFGGGYPYSYSHKMVYGIGKTRELAWESTLEASRMLERGKLNGIYQRNEDLLDRYCDYGEEKINDVFGRYVNIAKLFRQELTNPNVYRVSSWNSENIYVIGETKEARQGDSRSEQLRQRVGIYIKSNFVYNP